MLKIALYASFSLYFNLKNVKKLNIDFKLIWVNIYKGKIMPIWEGVINLWIEKKVASAWLN